MQTTGDQPSKANAANGAIANTDVAKPTSIQAPGEASLLIAAGDSVAAAPTRRVSSGALLTTSAQTRQANSTPASGDDPETVPAFWFLAGDNWANYRVASDHRSVWKGAASASIEAIDETLYGFGTLMQAASAESVRGKRIEFAAFVRTEGTWAGVGLWFRADDADGVVVSFDNMSDRWIRGDSAWSDSAIVIDVPPKTVRIAYGLILAGRGKAWIDHAQVTIVDATVPTTAPPIRPRPEMAAGWIDVSRLPPAPRNLDFEETVRRADQE